MQSASLETVNRMVTHFDTVSLGELDSVRLMDRTDMKYILPMHLLGKVVDKLQPDYRILLIEGNRVFSYRTEYFDTPEMVMFRDHHNGKLNRFKIRQREYLESRLSFLEVKFKSSTGRVIKQRVERTEDDEHLFTGFVTSHTPYDPGNLKSAVVSRFNRFTLTDRKLQERVTVDFNLAFSGSHGNVQLNGLVIIELKQLHRNPDSQICRVLKDLTVRPSAISKYCIGISLLYENPKSNNFRDVIRQINKISHVERSA